MQQRSNLTAEVEQTKINLESILADTENIKKDNIDMKKKIKVAEEERIEIGQEIEFLQSKLTDKKEDVNMNMRVKHSYDDQVKILKEEVEERTSELTTKKLILENTKKRVHELQVELKDLNQKMNSCTSENNKTSNDMKEISKEIQKQIVTNEELEKYNNDHIKSISAKNTEILKLKKELAKLKKQSEILAAKIIEVEQENSKFQNEKQKVHLKINQNDEPIKMKKETEMLNGQMEGLKRELEILNRHMKLSLKGEVNISILIELNDKKLKDLKQEFITGNDMITEYQETISKIKLDIEKKCEHVENSKTNYREAFGSLVHKDERIKVIQEEHLELEKLLREQKRSYKVVSIFNMMNK